MINKIKKLFVIGSVVSGLFMAISACGSNSSSQSSQQETSSQQSSSSSSASSSSSSSSSNGSNSSSSSQKPVVVLSNISATSNKTGYERGEELDIVVTAYYSDGSTTTIDNYEVEGFDNKNPGEQTITIKYEGKTCSLPILVRKPVLTSISAISKKDSFEYGEELDIVVTAYYSDSSSVVIDDYQVEGYNAQLSSEQTVLVSYQGQTCSLNVKVNDPILLNISIEGNKNTYEYGEELNISVNANYSDGSSVAVNEYEIEGFDSKTPGQQTVTVKYEGKTFVFGVEIKNPVLTGISATGIKDSYEYGEELDINVIASYSDNSSKEVINYEVEGFDNTKPGKQTVTIKYEGKTYTFKITINNPVLTGITAFSNKESYEYGDDLDVIVIASYSDGSTVEVTNYIVEGFNKTQSGIQTLTFTFEGKTCSLDIAVNERTTFFPIIEFKEFLQIENISTEIPYPIGFNDWTNGLENEQDGSHRFVASTTDFGIVGTDSIADQFAAVLASKDWTINSENGEYTATKEDGDALIVFSTNNKKFSLKVEYYKEFPDTKVVGGLIKSSKGLKNGDVVVIGSVSEEFIVSGFNDGSFSTSECLCEEDKLDNVTKDTWRFVINKVDKCWTLTDINGRKLGATALGQLAWDQGSTEWSIVLVNKLSLIMNSVSEYGRLCYDPNDGRITTYATAANSDLVYPQLFKLTKEDLIYPTEISIKGREVIGYGKTNRMSLNYIPKESNSFNDVVWSSSNEGVATVDEKGVVTGVSIGKATITAQTKSKGVNLESSYEIEIKNIVADSWTIMVYMCGSDLESGSGLASSDIKEILSTPNQPDDVNVLIETGGTSRWWTSGIDSNALSRYHVKNKQLVLDEKLSKANMGKQSTFESFLNWGLDKYPADKTGVVLWNHGGALGGCCYDDYQGSDSLVNSESLRAFKNVFEAHGIDKLEFVGYDACLMQIQDVAEFNSHYFNYMVGSEEAEDGQGWVYNKWLDDVYADEDTDKILKENCDSFVDKYDGDQTLSYLDLSKMSNYCTKFEALSSSIKNTVKNNYNAFKSLLRSVKSYTGFSSYGVMDGLDFLNKLESNSTYSSFKDQIEEVKTAYNGLVSYSRKGSRAGASNGLAAIAGAFVSYPSSETSFNNWRSLFN